MIRVWAVHLFHCPEEDEAILEGRERADPCHLCGVVARGFAVVPMTVVEVKVVRASSSVEEGNLADNVSEASGEEGECAGCERGHTGVVERDL